MKSSCQTTYPKQLNFSRNAIDQFWIRRLGSRHALRGVDVNGLETLFPKESILEHWHLNQVHKAILKLNHFDLATTVQSSSKREINQRDKHGRTALSWAVCRSDTFAVSLLINHGADVNIMDPYNRNALIMAIQVRCESCIRLLLDAGTDVTKVDIWGWHTLHHCCYRGCQIDIVETLLLSGADIEAKTGIDGDTSLCIAVENGNSQICDFLLSRKAKLNVTNHLGESPLHIAIHGGYEDLIRLLLERKADHLLKTKAGESLLHYAAQYGNIECFQVLDSYRLDGFNLEDKVWGSSPIHKSKELFGLTALNIAEKRTDATSEWLEEFRRLVHSVEATNFRSSLDYSRLVGTVEVDEFEDALENQDMK